MNVYQKLQESYRRFQHDRWSYHDRAVKAVSDALTALRDHIDPPAGRSRFEPIARDRQDGTVYAARAAVTHDKNGWWSGCLLIDFSPDGTLPETIAVTISAFVDSDKVLFEVGDSEQRHACQEVNAETLLQSSKRRLSVVNSTLRPELIVSSIRLVRPRNSHRVRSGLSNRLGTSPRA